MAKNVIRVALPGYDALDDTNLDHFALYTDEDNILIKEKERGQSSITSGNSVDIAHNLGYVPLFFVFVNLTSISANAWALVGLGSILSSLYFAGGDTSNIVIGNLTGGTLTFKYFIFYDNQVGSSAVTITESQNVFKVGKSGINVATSKDPNDYIFHSDLNSLKILYQGKTTINFNSGSADYSFAHNSPLGSTSVIICFAQFPDGKLTQVAWYGTPSNSAKSYSNLQGIDGKAFDSMYFDETNIYIHNVGVVTAYNVIFIWYVLEASI